MTSDWQDPAHRGLPGFEPDEPSRRQPPSGGGGRGPADDGDAPDATRLAWLVVGALAIAAGTALGWDADALGAIVAPPTPIRAALVGLAAGIGLVLLFGALNRLAADDRTFGRADGGPSTREIGTMIRGVRLVFLAVAAFAAAAGWLVGHPLPLVVALVIAGVDVLETSFLLIVVGLQRRG
jgi:uncharacterized membrane protein YjgN (DUF898 family)